VFEAVEAAFDDVALPVDLPVDGRWAPASAALGGAARDLVPAFGDGVADTPAS